MEVYYQKRKEWGKGKFWLFLKRLAINYDIILFRPKKPVWARKPIGKASSWFG